MSQESCPQIHPSAVIDPLAELAPDVDVGPYAVIGPRSVIGPGTRIGAHAIIGSDTRLGSGNVLHHHAVLGTDSQDLKYTGGKALLEVGDQNIFREFVTVNRATAEGTATRIGNQCVLLAYSHVAHNCLLGDGVLLANATQLGGEVEVGEHAVISGLAGIHQFCRIGAYAIVGGCSKVTQDILPFVTADGHPARPRGLNLVGLKRHRFSREALSRIKEAYHEMFHRGIRLDEALAVLTHECADAEDCPGAREVMRMVEFARSSSRRIARPRGPMVEADDIV